MNELIPIGRLGASALFSSMLHKKVIGYTRWDDDCTCRFAALWIRERGFTRYWKSRPAIYNAVFSAFDC